MGSISVAEGAATRSQSTAIHWRQHCQSGNNAGITNQFAATGGGSKRACVPSALNVKLGAMNNDAELRKQLVKLLEGRQAHLDFATALKDFPVEEAGSKPGGVPHSGWQLLEHLRITQRDILQFSLGTDYPPLKWPDEYWPKTEAPPDAHAWSNSVKAFGGDLEALKKLAADTQSGSVHAVPPRRRPKSASRNFTGCRP